MIRWCVLAIGACLVSACGGRDADVIVERVVEAPLRIAVQGEGLLKSSKATPLQVPGAQWAERMLIWSLPEGAPVREGEVIARFTAVQGELDLAQAMIDLERNALARVGREDDLEAGRGRVEVDLSKVGIDLGIARRYADADLSTIARNEALDAVQDVRFLGQKEDTLQWRQGQFGRRGGAELAVLDAQRATFSINAKRRQDDLDALELRAPHDGVLMLATNWTGDKPQVGATMRAGFEFGSLPDPNAMEVELELPQLEAQGIKAGDAVELAPMGRPEQRIRSTLSWVASGAKVRSRQSPVKYIAMKAPIPAQAVRRLGLVPGQKMVARVVLLDGTPALSVPNVAIDAASGAPVVQVREGGRLVARAIQLGVRGQARSQVLKGLRAGEEVVVARGDAATVGQGEAAPDADQGDDA